MDNRELVNVDTFKILLTSKVAIFSVFFTSIDANLSVRYFGIFEILLYL